MTKTDNEALAHVKRLNVRFRLKSSDCDQPVRMKYKIQVKRQCLFYWHENYYYN